MGSRATPPKIRAKVTPAKRGDVEAASLLEEREADIITRRCIYVCRYGDNMRCRG